MAMLTRELIGRLPKAELHVHLDGSLRPETMVELARKANVALPSYDPEPLRRFMLVDDAANLQDYLDRFDLTIPLLQTPESVERVAYEMVEDAARDNVRYLEVRYCPHLSQRQGMTLDEVMQAELRGLARGERDFGVVARVINCSLRHYEPAVSVEIAGLAANARIVHVIGARAPLHVTAAGKLFLLEDGFPRLREYSKRTGLAAHSRNSLTTLAMLERDLERTQKQGYATDNEEIEIGVRCVAAPVRDNNGGLIAALSLSTPADRMKPQWGALVKDTAENICKALGHAPGR